MEVIYISNTIYICDVTPEIQSVNNWKSQLSHFRAISDFVAFAVVVVFIAVFPYIFPEGSSIIICANIFKIN